jgi:uncharacterized membrane protein
MLNLFKAPRLLNIVYLLSLLFIITIISYFTKSLWVDELLSIEVAESNFTDFWKKITKDYHPPLYFLLLKIWIHMFGKNEFILRIFQMCQGIFLFYAYLKLSSVLFKDDISHLSKDTEGKYSFRNTGNLLTSNSLFLFFLSAELVLFMPMIRYYCLAAGLAVYSTYLFLSWLEDNKKFWPIIIIYILLLYSDYPTSIIILFHFFYFLFFLIRSDKVNYELIKKYFYIAFITTIFYLPWLWVLFQQIKRIQKHLYIADFNQNISSILLKFGFSIYAFFFSECSFPLDIFIISFIVIIFLLLIIRLPKKNLKFNAHFFFLLLIVTGAIFFNSLITSILSTHTSFVYIPSRSLYALPFFFMILFYLQSGLRRKWDRRIFWGFILIVQLYGIGNWIINRNFLNPIYASPWKEMVSFLKNKSGFIIIDESHAFQYYTRNEKRLYPNLIPHASLKILKKKIKKSLYKKNTKKIKLFIINSNRDSTSSYISTEVWKYIKENAILHSEKKFLPIDSDYKWIKEKLLKRKTYSFKYNLYHYTFYQKEN